MLNLIKRKTVESKISLILIIISIFFFCYFLYIGFTNPLWDFDIDSISDYSNSYNPKPGNYNWYVPIYPRAPIHSFLVGILAFLSNLDYKNSHIVISSIFASITILIFLKFSLIITKNNFSILFGIILGFSFGFSFIVRTGENDLTPAPFVLAILYIILKNVIKEEIYLKNQKINNRKLAIISAITFFTHIQSIIILFSLIVYLIYLNRTNMKKFAGEYFFYLFFSLIILSSFLGIFFGYNIISLQFLMDYFNWIGSSYFKFTSSSYNEIYPIFFPVNNSSLLNQVIVFIKGLHYVLFGENLIILLPITLFFWSLILCYCIKDKILGLFFIPYFLFNFLYEPTKIERTILLLTMGIFILSVKYLQRKKNDLIDNSLDK
jgi:hypothetical protein